jgi:hypothetical protein
MGAFNTVIAEVVCPKCRKWSEFQIQFKYGNTWQHAYRIGEKLQWGGNDIGLPGKNKVKVESIGGPCPQCGIDAIEFDVIVEADIITGVVPVGLERSGASEEGYTVIEE